MGNGSGRVIAGITASVDGYVTGPDAHAGAGLGGERLHHWVMAVHGPTPAVTTSTGRPASTASTWPS